MTEPAPLDLALIEALEQRFGRAVFASFVQQYLDEVPPRLAVIQAALAAGDIAALQRQGHDLTTSSGTIGIAAVAAASRDCEVACKSDDREAALAAAALLPPRLEEAVAALKSRYPEFAG